MSSGKQEDKSPSVPSKPNKGLKPSDHPAGGMWKDREDLKDPTAWIRKLRDTPRFPRSG